MASQQTPMRIEAPDTTYKSLVALLSSPAASANSHLALLGAANLSTSISHYLGTLPTEEASRFAQLLVTSSVFWSSSLSSPPSSSNDTLVARSHLLFEATARAVLARIQVVVHQHKGSVGWSSRRSLVAWLRALTDAVHIDASSVPTVCQGVPITSIAVHTGLVAGLHAARAQYKQAQKATSDEGSATTATTSSNTLSTYYALRRAEQEWCSSLTDCMRSVLVAVAQDREQANEDVTEQDAWEVEFRKASLQLRETSAETSVGDPNQNPHVVFLYLAAQISPYVSTKRLAIVPAEDLIAVLSGRLLGLFEGCGLLQMVREDVKQDQAGHLILSPTSYTVQCADSLVRHPLFALVGPLSRLLSLAFSGMTQASTPTRVEEVLLMNRAADGAAAPLTRMYAIAQSWQARWFSSRLAGANENDIAEGSRASTKQLWTIFKTLLFSYTMIFDALMEAIVDICPSPTETRPVREVGNAHNGVKTEPLGSVATGERWRPTTESNIPPVYLEIIRVVLLTYARLSWITSTFGSATFDAYRRVFYEALEVLARDGRASVALTKELLPSSSSQAICVNSARRAESTYLFDVTEQLMAQLPDDMVQEAILPACRLYLDDRTYQETFEAAHSVVLSIYSTGKECLLEITPYYVRLLLESFPQSLTADQLMLAFSTVMDAVSDGSDTLAWHVLEVLWREIEKERFLDGTMTMIGGTPAETQQTGNPGSSKRQQDLCLVFVAQVPNVNLVLLRSTLSRVKRLIMQRQHGGEARLELLQRTFTSLAGLDASTREEGVRWWLAERERFGV